MSYANNKRAHFDFEILETIEAGLVLLGTEVKSIRNGRVKIDGSYIVVKDGVVQLVGANIPAFQPKNTEKSYNPVNPRPVLFS